MQETTENKNRALLFDGANGGKAGAEVKQRVNGKGFVSGAASKFVTAVTC